MWRKLRWFAIQNQKNKILEISFTFWKNINILFQILIIIFFLMIVIIGILNIWWHKWLWGERFSLDMETINPKVRVFEIRVCERKKFVQWNN